MIYMLSQFPYNLDYFFQLLTESCAMNYCQDGLQVYFKTEPETATEFFFQLHLSGHYELQPNDVNGRPYFKMGSFGLWWDGIDRWWISSNDFVGQAIGYANYEKDVFCPHQLSEWNWRVWDGSDWTTAGNDLGISCKCIIIQTKTVCSSS